MALVFACQQPVRGQYCYQGPPQYAGPSAGPSSFVVEDQVCYEPPGNVYTTELDAHLARIRQLADGRPIWLALLDNQFTRTIGVYGGFEWFDGSGSDVFQGEAGLDNAYAVGIIQGRRHSTYLRSLFDFTYRHGDLDAAGMTDGDIEVFSILKNIYVDLNNPRLNDVTPYLGFGFGAAYVDAEGFVDGAAVDVSSEWAFAWQVFAGTSFKLNEDAHLFAEYRYFSTEDVLDSASSSSGAYSSNELFFGIRLGL